jgi:hypothetical protein
MAISLPSDVMGSGEKLQLALSGCRGDTGCIEIHRRSETIAGRAADQQKARIPPGLSLVFTPGRRQQRRLLLEINTDSDPT